MSRSRYMGNSRAQIPLRLTTELEDAATYRIGHIDANSGYQAQAKYRAAMRWIEAIEKREYVYLGVAGAATPVGIGGLIADLIKYGLVDAIVSTGANVYHDLHFACGLPVRHGSCHVDDEDLRRDETTRIYTQFIHNNYTLKAQDFIVQRFSRNALKRLSAPFSTATFLNELGKEMLADSAEYVVDREGSFVVAAAKYGVPVFLDSGSNHSLGMNLSLLSLEGINADTSPSRDIIEAAALSMFTQPQLNVFLGEGGPRNFTQTTAPTAAEIFYIPFDGSAGFIRFTTADERTGGLSGSGESEAVTWGKYKDANPDREVVIWGEYTLTAPDVMAYVSAHVRRTPQRLMDRNDFITRCFVESIEKHKADRTAAQEKLWQNLPAVISAEIEARKQAGYRFE